MGPGPGEIVLAAQPGDSGMNPIGETINGVGVPALRIVGLAYSVTGTADAWVAPQQIGALQPTATQLLLRFRSAATGAQLTAGLATVTDGLPAGALLGSRSYLDVRQAVNTGPASLVPFLLVFGILGLVVAVMIVANVISGAVVAGFRHIGVLKALGFTPAQVVMVYLMMVSIPAIAGCVPGTVLGNLLAQPLLNTDFEQFGAPTSVPPWVDVVAVLGMPLLVGLAAIVPALRAHGVSAVAAISAGNAPRPGRGLLVQRRLSGTRLPRSVSLGLGLPFTRPGRSALTMVAVVLGVVSVTFAIGLSASLTRFGDADPAHHVLADQAVLTLGPGPAGGPPARLDDDQIRTALLAVPGAIDVTTEGSEPAGIVGSNDPVFPRFLQGNPARLGYLMVRGRWYRGPTEIVPSAKFLHSHHLSVGDSLTLDVDGRFPRVTIVGEVMTGGKDEFFADWQLLRQVLPDAHAFTYYVQLAPGTDVSAFRTAARAAEPGLEAASTPGISAFNVTVIGFSSLLTLLLGTVTALGVFNTVVLNTRERRRDLGMLKSIGMTPRQVTVMMVTSMAALGAVGGLLGVPLGMLAHRLIMPMTSRAAGIDVPGALLDVWTVPLLAGLVLAGVLIATLGALIPAGSAARLTIAEVLHTE